MAPAVFKTDVVEYLGQAGSIPVRLRHTLATSGGEVVTDEIGCRSGSALLAGLPRARPGKCASVGVREWIESWPVVRQSTGADRTARGDAARSATTEARRPRTADADRVVASVCPYCAVGCGQKVFVTDGAVTQIEGDPDSPISRGRLCPKGAASRQLVTQPGRITTVHYRRPGGTDWEDLDLGEAMEMIADRVLATRRETWEDSDPLGRTLNRTMGIAHLGGATLDNEENYVIKKLWTALGAIQVENQARL